MVFPLNRPPPAELCDLPGESSGAGAGGSAGEGASASAGGGKELTGDARALVLSEGRLTVKFVRDAEWGDTEAEPIVGLIALSEGGVTRGCGGRVEVASRPAATDGNRCDECQK